MIVAFNNNNENAKLSRKSRDPQDGKQGMGAFFPGESKCLERKGTVIKTTYFMKTALTKKSNHLSKVVVACFNDEKMDHLILPLTIHKFFVIHYKD